LLISRSASALPTSCPQEPRHTCPSAGKTSRYAYRLRAIGHLHEAEDESQAGPDFHAAIRAARKAYQTDGTMPGGAAQDQAAKPDM